MLLTVHLHRPPAATSLKKPVVKKKSDEGCLTAETVHHYTPIEEQFDESPQDKLFCQDLPPKTNYVSSVVPSLSIIIISM